MIYYRFHIGDYLRDTAHLTLLEHGAYRILLDLYYQHARPLPKAIEQVCRISRCKNKQERVTIARMLNEFFTETPDGWVNHRCDEEIGLMMGKSEKARLKANRRWRATALPQQCKGNASRYPLSNNASALGDSSTRGIIQSPLKRFPEKKQSDPADIERNRDIAAAAGRGDTDGARRLRDGAA